MPSPSRQFRNGERATACEDMGYRSLEVRSSSLDVEARTIDADISTETPVAMPDWQRGEMVNEILVASGAQIPKSRQVPFLDSHNRYSVSDQLGSARNVTIDGNRVTAKLYFSEAANSEFTKVREGHVTDVSVGYEVMKRVYVPAGETKQVAGRSYEGPVNVVTKWRLREVSLTPIGADAQAKLRGLDPAAFRFQSEKGPFEMNEELRKLLVAAGMPESHNDDDAQRWLVANPDKLAKREEAQQVTKKHGGDEKLGNVDVRGLDTNSIQAMIYEATRKIAEEGESKRAAFHKSVDALCDLADLPELKSQARALANEDEVRSLLVTEKAKRAEVIGSGPNVRVTGSGVKRFITDIGTALNLRAMDGVAPPLDVTSIEPISTQQRRELSREKVFPKAQHGAGYQQWGRASLYDLAYEFVRNVYGVDTRGLSRDEIAITAMFGTRKAREMGYNIRSGDDAAYHTTGSFANLTLDATNKSMMLGYTEAPSTWLGPMRQGASVSDFKNVNRMRLGAISNLPVWNDNNDPEKASFADAKETYAVESRSLDIGFSYRLLVNDDMDALSRTPGQMGGAARRTVNAVAWSQITSNPTMSDGKSLFLATASGNRFRANLTTGAGEPSVTTLQTLTNLMMQMRGENQRSAAGVETESSDILALQPRYLVGPTALRTKILQLTLSVYDPGNANQAYNTGSELIPVIEPLLDSDSTTAWMLFADPSRIDTVEVSFLQGQETPVVRQVMDERNLSQSFIVMQTFGAKAMNHRGIQRHAGA